METGFLNFHNEAHFSDFPLSMDDQHILLAESHGELMQVMENDYHYIENLDADSGDAYWETEQELNGDLALLPISGVSQQMPKVEIIKEDFAKVLTDWQEHVGYLQASELEDEINLDLGMQINGDLLNEIVSGLPKIENETESTVDNSNWAYQNAETINPNTCAIKTEVPEYPEFNGICKRLSESDSSDIDVVGLDSIDEISFIKESLHERSQHIPSKTKVESRNYNSKRLDDNKIIIKHEPISIKDEPIYYQEYEKSSDVSPPIKKLQTIKNSKKKQNKSQAKISIKKEQKVISTKSGKATKKLKKHVKPVEIPQEQSKPKTISVATTINGPAIEAGDVSSLLEKFEASEAASIKKVAKGKIVNASVNKSQEVLLKKSVKSQNSKQKKDVLNFLPKEVVDRIKASGPKKSHLQVIPALPQAKPAPKGNRVKSQESATTSVQDKSTKTASNNLKAPICKGSLIKVDHDYCTNKKAKGLNNSSNSNTSSQSSSASSSIISSPNDYTKQISDGEQQHTPRKLNAFEVSQKAVANRRSFKDSGLESGETSDASEELNRQKLVSQKGTATKKIKSQAQPVHDMKIQSAPAANSLQIRSGETYSKTKPLSNKQLMVSVLKKPPQQQQLRPNESIVTTTNSYNNEVHNIIVQPATPVIDEKPDEKPEQKPEPLQPPRKKLNLAEYRSRREYPIDNVPTALLYMHNASTSTEPISSDQQIWCEREIVPVFKPKSELEEDKLKPKPPTRNVRMQTKISVFGPFKCKSLVDIEDQQEPPTECGELNKSEVVAIKTEPIEEGEIEDEGNQETDGKNNEDTQVVKEIIPGESTEKTDVIIVDNEKETVVAEPLKKNEINKIRDRASRNYRRYRESSESSRSRSKSRSRSRTVVKSTRRTRSNSHRSRSRSSRSRSRTSRSRSQRRSPYRRRRRIGRRRSSVSSRSSWSSRSRSRSPRYRSSSSSSGSSRSRSISSRSSSRGRSRSRSRTSRYSGYSRSSSRSNIKRSSKRTARRRKSRSREHGRRYKRRCSSSGSHGRYKWRSRSPTPLHSKRSGDEWYLKEKQRQVEERRVMYVGRLEKGTSKFELRRRFEIFGPVLDISLHFRDKGHNYGFVTFANKNDAYQAVEHGNDDSSLPRYDLCFGGRRAFCQVKYADLDSSGSNSYYGRCESDTYQPAIEEDNSFDSLLKQAQAKLRKRKV